MYLKIIKIEVYEKKNLYFKFELKKNNLKHKK